MEDARARRSGHAPTRATSAPRPDGQVGALAPPPLPVRRLGRASSCPNRSTLLRAKGPGLASADTGPPG
eukprot:1989307-Alexandrium_andersonii.AAC.1